MSRLLLQNKEKTQCLLCKSKRQLYKRKRNPNKRARDRLLRKNSHSKCKRNLLNTPFMRMLITNLESLCRNMSISKKYRIKSYPSREKTSRSLQSVRASYMDVEKTRSMNFSRLLGYKALRSCLISKKEIIKFQLFI